MKNLIYTIILFLLFSCGKKDTTKAEKETTPMVDAKGETIVFPDSKSVAFFKTEKVNSENINAEIQVPAQIVATSVGGNIVLFNNPDLTANYTELINHNANIIKKQAIIQQKQAIIQQKQAIIRQKQVEIERFADLVAHGASTGKELSDAKVDKIVAESDLNVAMSEKEGAESDLIAERSLIIEHQSKLKMAGFNPQALLNSSKGMAFIIADIPENQMSKMKAGSSCKIQFTAFPDEVFTGKIEDIADVVDNITRMVKLRISVNNSSSKLKSGMFANVSFGLREGNFISVSKNSLITVQGKNYVFVKTSPSKFERREIQIGQQINDRVIVFGGLNNGDEVANEGVMQLKGLSFGY